MLSGDDFGRLFDTFERTAFRLETLDTYDVDDEREELARFLAGQDMGPEWADNSWVRSMTDRGKQVSRVHVLRSPLSDYLRFELAAYPGNVRAGEHIGIVDLSEQSVTGLPDHDFWLFDDRDVYRMHYTREGAFIGAALLPADSLAEYRGYRDAALAHAVPFGAYWERHH
ncbi:DUF6879 family protein [Streptomyces xanthochromogenes]|uniref:DUF6879 domain-containing protein n=1 Tax=Streptomyces xanthochromogenes TaxID=67384 RepID=A0ABQ2ZTI9_9ACTN|nr:MULTISPECIES: DUF6879 family protein [Streptomyces]MYV92100.1 hypothetical protein [Streptomyces sp. SID1034]GGY22305.1 hypothetical protein GCM10010326_14370 [Streptomyces xanthochromogenes]